MTQRNEILNEYFEWMCHLVCNGKYYSKVSYRKLLYFLNSVDFIPTMEMDDNRMVDGRAFRYQFGSEFGYTNEFIEDNLDIYNCSMLEMMVALAYRVETQITDDPSYGNRTGQWFWCMVSNLGLSHMEDSKFDRTYCEDVIDSFIKHRYSPKGDGALFKLDNPPEDMRDVDIWCQCMWYLNETIYDTQVKF